MMVLLLCSWLRRYASNVRGAEGARALFGCEDATQSCLARFRWWKRFDESHLQPVFGGPAVAATATARLGQESSQHGGSQQSGSSGLKPSGRSFTVPATSRRG